MAGCSRRRRPSSPSPVPAPPLEDDDLLHEIFLRLPPQPPYLMRASLVSKRWRRLATNRKFLRRFRIHHRNPPLLGDFSYEEGQISFRSTLDPPYRIPPDHFTLRVGGRGWALVDCRHGRVFVINTEEHQLIVWDPITGDHSLVAVPPEFGDMTTGAVLCAAGDQGHVHGACHSAAPFKVALLNSYEHDDDAFAFASVYSSETGIWSDILWTQLPYRGICFSFSSTLIGNSLHWLLWMNDNILEFDLDMHTLVVIKSPPSFYHNISVQIIQAEDGGVGLAVFSWSRFHHPFFKIWERKVNCNGVAVWVLRKSVEARKLLGLGSKIDMGSSRIVHYAEDLHAIFVWVDSSVFMVQLKTMQYVELFKSDHVSSYYPFTSFQIEGILE